MEFLWFRLSLLILVLFSFSSLAHADSDDVDWSDYSLYTDYDEWDEELEIKFSTYSDGNPDEDFILEMEIGDENCEMELEYKSFQVTGECILDIKDDEIRGLYDTKITVDDEDDDTVYTDNNVEIEIDGYQEDFDWDDLKVDATYDEKDEDLELKIYMEDISRDPDYDYEIEFEIDNKNFKKKFSYDEDESELSFSFDTPVDKDEIEDEYDIGFEVFNTDLDDEEVWDGDLEFEVEIIWSSDDLDWDKLDYTALYDEDRSRLALNFILSNVKTEPNGSYKSFIEFEREDYDEKFNYDDDEEHLIAEYSIKIDEDDLGNYYDIDIKIEDQDDDEVFDDEIDVDIEYLSEADDFDWDDLEVSASYNENKEILYIELVLEWIKSTPTFTYTTDLEFADEEEFKKFTYNSDEDELRASIDVRIDEDDIENEYEFDIKIENDDQERVYNEDIDVEITDYKDVAQEEDSDYDWENTTIDFDYSTSSQYLTIEVELEWINDYPSLDYFTEINLSGVNEEIGSKLRYDSANKRLYGTYNLFIKENDIEDEYKLTMFINDEYNDLQHLATGDFDVIFDKADEKDEKDEEEWEKYVSASTKKAVDNFMEKIYKRYDDESDAIAYFKVVITTLDAYADSKTRYRSVIDDINYLLQEEIDNN